MRFENQDRAELAKIGVHSLLDLALLLPKSFENTTITNDARQGQVCLNVKINTCRRANGGLLIITAHAIQWDCEIKIAIFNAKPWHYGAFKHDKELIIIGICSYSYGAWQITNPKIITKTGQISPRYKTDIKDEKVISLIKKYLSLEALLNEGLSKNEALFLMKFHENNENSIIMHEKLKSENLGIDVLKFVEIFNYIKKLSAKKTQYPNQKITPHNISDWLKTLPFTPTNDQLNAINDIRTDLTSEFAKRRVVMGDVGSGKTLVILAAALSVYPKKAVLMAPTSILAEQIFNEALRLLPQNFNTILIKSGDKDIDYKDANLIIGTHVLLYQDLPSAAIVMVDEQHRFGSAQRAKIDELVRQGQTRATYVQFSATPIPRTLSLIQSNFVNFSFLKQIPFKKTIHSQIIKNSDFAMLLAHIKREISQQKQIIIVYPLVQSSETSNYQSLNDAQNFWLERFNNVYITHGKDKNKEQVLREFKQNGDILLSTTVVEVGISLPRLSTILIVGAERLGLATLHQLRGRVGRNGGVGYCFLYTKSQNIPPRLKDFCQTLDGFEIAELDLKNRQSGDILDGSIQHGATFDYYNYEENIAKEASFRLNKIN
ncbi:ATP-dependent DNA helicase RecG [Campylobacter majalis]|uniref:ATP-dependent DNA helicase RecG n=1 Tax=Campylobacter majalis TaxID=2790656 RepID=UPI003D69AABC